MIIELVGKFYDNHSLSIVNRKIALALANSKKHKVLITALDEYDPEYKLDKKDVKILKELASVEDIPDIQVRHSYPPIWSWPTDENTKVVYIQPWEYPKVPFEWQYKFETFADALIVPSNFCADIFKRGGINPDDIFVVPNGYEEEIFNEKEYDQELVKTLGIDPNKFNFVYVGNSQWRKGLDILLNTWHKIFKSFDNARLIIKDNPRIYGQNNILNETIKMQYKTDCAGITYIDKDLSDIEMAAIFKASDVVVHPYRAEGFGMHIQEAVACGCYPMITAEGPTNDFISDEGGYKLPVANKHINIASPEIFALKPGDSSNFMGSHTFVKEPIAEGLERALRFVYYSHDREKILNNYKNNKLTTWTEVGIKYIEVLENIVSRKPKRYR
jgi:glycosyltransferase involved in cell wall biosynthesis